MGVTRQRVVLRGWPESIEANRASQGAAEDATLAFPVPITVHGRDYTVTVRLPLAGRYGDRVEYTTLPIVVEPASIRGDGGRARYEWGTRPREEEDPTRHRACRKVRCVVVCIGVLTPVILRDAAKHGGARQALHAA